MRGRTLLAGMVVAALAAGVSAGAPGAATAASPGRLAFTAGDFIFTVNADGSGRRQLTRGLPTGGPAWSPDGATIAFSRDSTVDNTSSTQIWAMSPDGSAAHAVTPTPAPGVGEYSPAWSPDGSRLAFSRTRVLKDSLVTSLVTIGADGSGERTIVSETAHSLVSIYAPSWSPDGQRLLYTRSELDRTNYFRPALYSVTPDGGDARLLASDAGSGAWSPDGARIAFVSVRDRNGFTCGSDECSYDGEIYVMNPDGAAPLRLTASKADDEAPAWSPDGQRIAFQSDRNYPDGQSPEIYTMRPDGSCLTWLTNGTASSGGPAWDPRSGSSDPGACGATDRPPLLDVDSRAIRSFKRFRLYWLGPIATSGLLLSYASVGSKLVDLIYDDCGHFDPAHCPSPAELQENATCRGHPFLLSDTKPRVSIVRGAVVYEPRGPDQATEVYTGRTTIRIFSDRVASTRRIVQALRPVRGTRAKFARATFPQGMWHALGRTEAAYRELGSARAAGRHLGISTYAVRRRVALLHKLRTLGPLGHLRCGHIAPPSPPAARRPAA